VHILLGCGIQDNPLSVVLGFANNLAFAHDMKSILEFGFYAGTFGPNDRDAIRRFFVDSDCCDAARVV